MATEVDDVELRGRFLKAVYDLRRANGGWVPVSDMNFSDLGQVDLNVIGSVGDDLARAGLIEWRPLRSGPGVLAAGMAHITGHGVDVYKGNASSSIKVNISRPVGEAPANGPAGYGAGAYGGPLRRAPHAQRVDGGVPPSRLTLDREPEVAESEEAPVNRAAGMQTSGFFLNDSSEAAIHSGAEHRRRNMAAVLASGDMSPPLPPLNATAALQGVAAQGIAGDLKSNVATGIRGVEARATAADEDRPPAGTTLIVGEEEPSVGTAPVMLTGAGQMSADAQVVRATPDTINSVTRDAIIVAVVRNRETIDLSTTALSMLIEQKLTVLRADMRNEGRDELEKAIADYESLKAKVDELRAAAAKPPSDEKTQTAVVESTLGFTGSLQQWWTQRHMQFFDMGLFLSGLSVCWTLGASGPLVAGICGTLVGGKQIADAVIAMAKEKDTNGTKRH